MDRGIDYKDQTASYDSKIIEITFDKTHLNHILHISMDGEGIGVR